MAMAKHGISLFGQGIPMLQYNHRGPNVSQARLDCVSLSGRVYHAWPPRSSIGQSRKLACRLRTICGELGPRSPAGIKKLTRLKSGFNQCVPRPGAAPRRGRFRDTRRADWICPRPAVVLESQSSMAVFIEVKYNPDTDNSTSSFRELHAVGLVPGRVASEPIGSPLSTSPKEVQDLKPVFQPWCADNSNFSTGNLWTSLCRQPTVLIGCSYKDQASAKTGLPQVGNGSDSRGTLATGESEMRMGCCTRDQTFPRGMHRAVRSRDGPPQLLPVRHGYSRIATRLTSGGKCIHYPGHGKALESSADLGPSTRLESPCSKEERGSREMGRASCRYSDPIQEPWPREP
ncbi:hypothetical protein Micbo1qcDRAFT_176760 [Microdochium bolleyi]|uniref:Uncharacterized protein n=1 Tax=Microdochium bolleyi TaxID=196109 RepID=A0A136IZ63_9PEZI|nr:hypothetical protein Micbo1qcDRAFT_176760 [Microdochium bolleyi]